MLQPIDTFYPEIADIWVEGIRNIEIAELTCMNLFSICRMPRRSLFNGLRMSGSIYRRAGFSLLPAC